MKIVSNSRGFDIEADKALAVGLSYNLQDSTNDSSYCILQRVSIKEIKQVMAAAHKTQFLQRDLCSAIS